MMRWGWWWRNPNWQPLKSTLWPVWAATWAIPAPISPPPIITTSWIQSWWRNFWECERRFPWTGSEILYFIGYLCLLNLNTLYLFLTLWLGRGCSTLCPMGNLSLLFKLFMSLFQGGRHPLHKKQASQTVVDIYRHKRRGQGWGGGLKKSYGRSKSERFWILNLSLEGSVLFNPSPWKWGGLHK